MVDNCSDDCAVRPSWLHQAVLFITRFSILHRVEKHAVNGHLGAHTHAIIIQVDLFEVVEGENDATIVEHVRLFILSSLGAVAQIKDLDGIFLSVKIQSSQVRWSRNIVSPKKSMKLFISRSG